MIRFIVELDPRRPAALHPQHHIHARSAALPGSWYQAAI
jgi:hypothetical protein